MTLFRGVPLTNGLGGLRWCNKAKLHQNVQLVRDKGTDPSLKRTNLSQDIQLLTFKRVSKLCGSKVSFKTKAII